MARKFRNGDRVETGAGMPGVIEGYETKAQMYVVKVKRAEMIGRDRDGVEYRFGFVRELWKAKSLKRLK